MIRQKYNWIFHVVCCFIFLSIPFFSSPANKGQGLFVMNNNAWKDFIHYILLVIFFYINYFILITRLYFTRKYLIYILILIFSMWLIAYIPNIFFNNAVPMPPKEINNFPVPPNPPKEIINEPPPPPKNQPPGFSFFARVNHNIFLFWAVVFFSLLLRIRTRWLQSEKEKLSAELSYLKAQINPHFLFNSLNSIYSLAIQKSDSTSEAVQKLSSMMRYILSEATSDFVPLQKELEYIRNYIELQRLRFGDDFQIRYNIHGNYQNKKIAPLILISFIENAFKYGINAEEETNIIIDIGIKGNELDMMVMNNIVTVNINDENKSGIGLENTMSRLQLVYPNAHNIFIKDDGKQYTVNLHMNIA